MADDDRLVTILVRRNGPYRVYGPVKLIDQDANEFDIPPGDWFVLCRCGESENKPFCDSTHKHIDFRPETCVRLEADSAREDPSSRVS
jgi:CDGSH-type Zn-finger protein